VAPESDPGRPGDRPIDAALRRLVSDGTLTEAQADAVREARPLRVGLERLVSDGTLTQAQADAVREAAGAVRGLKKRSWWRRLLGRG
jgi:hypothetical protein